ncbi:TPA: glycosyltransferase [Pasteurella multocida]
MKRAKLFLSTSLKEGLPTVLIESMACGTPVISMDCPTGPKEILNDGEFGGLIPLKNEQAFIQNNIIHS